MFLLRPLLLCDHEYTSDPTYFGNGNQNISHEKDPTLVYLLSRIYLACQVLILGTETRVTSMVLFHRYYARYIHQYLLYLNNNKDNNNSNNSNNNNNIDVHHHYHDTVKQQLFKDPSHRNHVGLVACTCIFVACKIENQPRRIRDVLNVSHMLNFVGQTPSSTTAASSISTSLSSMTPRTTTTTTTTIVEGSSPPLLNEEYWEMKQRLISTEQAFLRFISFDVQVSQPHAILVIVWNHIFHTQENQDPNHNNNNKHNMYTHILQKSWRIINDTLFHPPCLRLPIVHIVCAPIHLAIQEYYQENHHHHHLDDEKRNDSRQEQQEFKQEQQLMHTIGESSKISNSNMNETTTCKSIQYIEDLIMINHLLWKQICSKDDLDVAIHLVQQATTCIDTKI